MTATWGCFIYMTAILPTVFRICDSLSPWWDSPFSYHTPPTSPRRKRTNQGKGKRKGTAWSRGPHPSTMLALSCGGVSSSTSITSAAAGGELAGGEGAAARSLRHGGGGGDLHPLVACLASFFFGHVWPHPLQQPHCASGRVPRKPRRRSRDLKPQPTLTRAVEYPLPHDSTIIPSLNRTLASDGRPSHPVAKGIPTPPFSASSPPWSLSVPRVPLPTYWATGTWWILTGFEVWFASRLMVPGSSVRAALTLSVWSKGISTVLVGAVMPAREPRQFRQRSPARAAAGAFS